jgi:hypothetical protein
MRKLRLALILPVVQFVIALALWPYPMGSPKGLVPSAPTIRTICLGMDAPALLFPAAVVNHWPVIRWLPLMTVGLPIDEFAFLFGVILLWFIVGQILDRLRSAKASVYGRQPTSSILIDVALSLAIIYGGIRLFVAGLNWVFPTPQSGNRLGYILGSIPLMAWAFALIIFPGLGLMRTIRLWYGRAARTPS